MKKPDVQIVSEVAAAGYAWKESLFVPFPPDSKDRPAPALAPIGGKSRRTPIPDELFLEFAALDPESDTDILAFANAHGLLGIRAPLGVIAAGKERPEDRIIGELKSDWGICIRQMKKATEIWMAVKTQNMELLSERIHWAGPRHVEYVGLERKARSSQKPFRDSETIILPGDHPELKQSDVIGRSYAWLLNTVNANLSTHVAYRLLRIRGSEDIGTFPLPINLAGAMWFKLAGVIATFSSIRSCDVCGKPMVIAPGGYRSNRRTCSDACRIRIYDARKHEARRLHQDKMPIKDIAIHLDTSIAQIQKWIDFEVKRKLQKAPQDFGDTAILKRA
jgi:hypothetical protein